MAAVSQTWRKCNWEVDVLDTWLRTTSWSGKGLAKDLYKGGRRVTIKNKKTASPTSSSLLLLEGTLSSSVPLVLGSLAQLMGERTGAVSVLVLVVASEVEQSWQVQQVAEKGSPPHLMCTPVEPHMLHRSTSHHLWRNVHTHTDTLWCMNKHVHCLCPHTHYWQD